MRRKRQNFCPHDKEEVTGHRWFTNYLDSCRFRKNEEADEYT